MIHHLKVGRARVVIPIRVDSRLGVVAARSGDVSLVTNVSVAIAGGGARVGGVVGGTHIVMVARGEAAVSDDAGLGVLCIDVVGGVAVLAAAAVEPLVAAALGVVVGGRGAVGLLLAVVAGDGDLQEGADREEEAGAC